MMNLRPIPEPRPASGLRSAGTGLLFLLLCSLPARAGVAGGNSNNGSGGGNNSDMGSTVVTAPAPRPWTPRSTTRISMEPARPHAIEATRKIARPARKTGFRPDMSASLAANGTLTVDASR